MTFSKPLEPHEYDRQATQDDTELSQQYDQSVIHWHARAVAAEAALAESTARADRLAVEVSELRAAFIQHRTATHEVAPTFCKTCRESDAVLNRPADTRGAAILGAGNALAEGIRMIGLVSCCNACDHSLCIAARAVAAWRALGVVGEE